MVVCHENLQGGRHCCFLVEVLQFRLGGALPRDDSRCLSRWTLKTDLDVLHH